MPMPAGITAQPTASGRTCRNPRLPSHRVSRSGDHSRGGTSTAFATIGSTGNREACASSWNGSFVGAVFEHSPRGSDEPEIESAGNPVAGTRALSVEDARYLLEAAVPLAKPELDLLESKEHAYGNSAVVPGNCDDTNSLCQDGSLLSSVTRRSACS